MAGFRRVFSIVTANPNFSNFRTNRNIFQNAPLCEKHSSKLLTLLGIPPKPKRPLTPFFKFMLAKRQAIAEQNPGLSGPKIVKIIAEHWAQYDPAEKGILQREFEVEMTNHAKRLMTYQESITPEQRKVIKEVKEKKISEAEKLQLKKKIIQLGRPKRPPTAFIQFLMEKKSSRQSNMPATDWSRTLSKEWSEMSADDKNKYKEEVAKLMKLYEAEMNEWEERMVSQGHLDVVRNRGLIYLKTVKSD